MDAHGLAAGARDHLGFVAARAVRDPLLDQIEIVTDPFGKLADHMRELIDNGVDDFDRCGVERAGRNRAADILHRAQRDAPHRDQKPVGHREAQPGQILGRIVEFELQFGDDADDLAAIDLDALMIFVAQHDLARDFAQRRMLLDPDAAASVSARQMNPDEALKPPMARPRCSSGASERALALGVETEGGDHAGSGRAVDMGKFGPIHRAMVSDTPE